MAATFLRVLSPCPAQVGHDHREALHLREQPQQLPFGIFGIKVSAALFGFVQKNDRDGLLALRSRKVRHGQLQTIVGLKRHVFGLGKFFLVLGVGIIILAESWIAKTRRHRDHGRSRQHGPGFPSRKRPLRLRLGKRLCFHRITSRKEE